MNLLRQTHFCNALKSYHRLNLFSISLPSSVSLHSNCKNNQFKAIETCANTKISNHLSQCLRNKKQLKIFQRFSSCNPQHVISPKNGLLSDFKSNIDPYKRLVRLDRPIGKKIFFYCIMVFFLFFNILLISWFFLFQIKRIMASVLAVWLEYCVERNSRSIA